MTKSKLTISVQNNWNKSEKIALQSIRYSNNLSNKKNNHPIMLLNGHVKTVILLEGIFFKRKDKNPCRVKSIFLVKINDHFNSRGSNQVFLFFNFFFSREKSKWDEVEFSICRVQSRYKKHKMRYHKIQSFFAIFFEK